MVPETFLPGDVGDLRERIDRAGIRGARRGEHEPGFEPPCAVHGDHFRERPGAQAPAPVHRDIAAHGFAHSRHAQRLVQTLVDVRRGVYDGVLEVPGTEPRRFTRRYDRDQARDRPPRREVAVCGLGKPDELSHPVEDQILHFDRSRAREAHAGVLVRHRGEVVGERRSVDPAAGDVGQMSGMRGQEPRAHDRPVDPLDELVHGPGPGPGGKAAECDDSRLVVIVGRGLRELVEVLLGVGVCRAQELVALGRVGVERP